MVDSFRIRHDQNLWTYEGSLTMLHSIFRLPSRMTTIRLSQSNQLAVFSPTNIIKKLIAEIGEFQFCI